MSEETEQPSPAESGDKRSALKEKLKKMGVMQDENAPPKEHHSFISRHKMPVIFILIVVGVLFWWTQNNDRNKDSHKVADRSTMQQPYGMGEPYGVAPPPPSPEFMRDEKRFAERERPTRPDWAPPSRRRPMPPPDWGTPPEWNAPETRTEDTFGPPPGPPSPDYMYGRPYGGYYAPPPPPAFYGPYGPYGPAPYYRYPGYQGYPGYIPPPGNSSSN